MSIAVFVFLGLVAALAAAGVIGTIVAVVRYDARDVPLRRGE